MDQRGQIAEQRVALVTGASRGIGRGIALKLARCGHAVVVNYAGTEAAARETAAACAALGVPAEICQADVSQSADRERLLAFTRERFGRLDLLVNNAGITSPGRADLLDTLARGKGAMNGYFARLERWGKRPSQNQVLLGLYRVATEIAFHALIVTISDSSAPISSGVKCAATDSKSSVGT